MEISPNEQINQKQIKFNVYCISCFLKEIWNKKLYTLTSMNPEIISIENIYEQELLYEKNFMISIHKLNFNKKILKINLLLKSKNNNKVWKLNEIIIKPDEEKFLFKDLQINLNNSYEFIKDLKENCNIKNNNYFDDNPKIYKNIKQDEKLKIYLDFLKKQKIAKEIKQNLVSSYFSILKEDNEILYSDIIEIFNISFGTKEIIIFLGNYTKLNLNIGIKFENKEFTNILNLYKNEPNKFFENNEKYFKMVKITDKNKEEINPVKKYKNLLENFITIYQIFYEESTDIKEKRLKNVRKTLISLINNKKDIISYMSFIELKFESFYKVLNLNNNEKLIVKKSLIENNHDDHLFIIFKDLYNLLINHQEAKGKFILDFSQIFNYFLDIIKDFYQLIKIKKIYKKELNIISNNDFENKIRETIHIIGLNQIQKGNYDNYFLIKYIKNDEFYIKPNKTNENIKFDIIKYFKIDLIDDKFLEAYNKYKIYSYFEENLLLYLKIFSQNIKGIKNFEIFFKILPIEKYNKDTINFVSEWIQKNINTFSIEKCPNFNNEIQKLFNLICDNKLISIAYSLIIFLKENLREYSQELFIFLLNSLDININSNIIDFLVNSILFTNNSNNNNDDNDNNEKIVFLNANLFLEKIKPNKVISRILLNNLQKYSIIYEDFFKENSPRFSLFSILINNKEYSLLNKDIGKITDYWENTFYTCNSLCQDLINLNITFIKISYTINILGEEILKKRIINIFKCVYVGDHAIKAISLISNLNEVISSWNEKLKLIEELKNYNNFIYNDYTSNNEKISEYIKKIIQSNLKYLNSRKGQEEFSNYEKDIKKAQEFSELKKSNVFLKIFNKNKNIIDDKKLLQTVLDKFNNLKNIFINDKIKIEEELKKNKDIKYLIDLGYESEKNNLEKEIDYLLNYFEICNFKYKDFLIEKIKKIAEYKSLYSVISGILILFEKYKNILNLNNKEDIDFKNEFREYTKLLRTKEYIPEEKINSIISNIEHKFKINLTNLENKTKIFNLFIAINQYPESIDFLKEKKSEQIYNLSEFLIESDDTLLIDKDINDFIKIVRFFEELIKNKERTFFDFVKVIIEGILDNNIIGGSLNNFIEKYSFIQKLFNQYLNHTEGCIKKIKNILKKSHFTIELNNDNEYSLKGTLLSSFINNEYQINNDNLILEKKEEKNYVYYSDLEYIFQRIYIAKIPETNKESVNQFITFFKNIKELIIILNELFRNGYQTNFRIFIDFKNSILTCDYQDKKNINIKDLMKDFTELNNYVKKQLFFLYNKKEIIRLFNNRQLYLIFDNIIKNNEIRNLDLFKVVFNNVIQDLKYKLYNIFFFNFEKLKETQKFISIMHLIIKYINKQLKYNNINIKDIYKMNEINIIQKPKQSINIVCRQKEKNDEYKGIYFYSSYKNQEL